MSGYFVIAELVSGFVVETVCFLAGGVFMTRARNGTIEYIDVYGNYINLDERGSTRVG
ncbi:hypothetical protein COMA1_10934 [Candidatus Nitrospira nitrosa]|uniref:Uncharacterized protein n=1 Tax=Candidatus Nitrospira nitrosa TaxID=1742972 RepID=A0A0S4L5U2_9BACT|nr:hypothetical protein COMA1_10934 [Candidatus Nitrospira nitrosa]